MSSTAYKNVAAEVDVLKLAWTRDTTQTHCQNIQWRHIDRETCSFMLHTFTVYISILQWVEDHVLYPMCHFLFLFCISKNFYLSKESSKCCYIPTKLLIAATYKQFMRTLSHIVIQEYLGIWYFYIYYGKKFGWLEHLSDYLKKNLFVLTRRDIRFYFLNFLFLFCNFR